MPSRLDLLFARIWANAESGCVPGMACRLGESSYCSYRLEPAAGGYWDMVGCVCCSCSVGWSGEELALKASLSSPSDSKEYRGMLPEIEDHNFRNSKVSQS